MRRILSKLVRECKRIMRYRHNRAFFDGYFKEIIKANHIKEIGINSPAYKEWKKKWSVFGNAPSPYGWQAFSDCMKEDVRFVPNDIARNFIEPVLTPSEFQPFYNDKNSLGMILDSRWLPKTFLRSMNGRLYDGNYLAVDKNSLYDLFKETNKLVVKPAKDMGGKGVTLFCRKGDIFTDDKGNVLSLNFLEKNYGRSGHD